MKRLLSSLVLVLAATGCSAQAPAADSAGGAATVPVVSPAATAAPVPGFDSPAAFGQTVTFPSGVQASVSVVSFAPAPANVGVVGEGNQATFALTITNKSGARIDASGMSWPKVAYGANLEAATPISNAKISTLLDGDKRTDQFARFIPAAEGGKVRVKVPAPDGGQSAIFEGSIAGK